MSRLAHLDEAYPGFCSMKQLEVSLLPQTTLLQVTLLSVSFPLQYTSTHFYSWVERGMVRVMSCSRTKVHEPPTSLTLNS